jgi:hypothetical protein
VLSHKVWRMGFIACGHESFYAALFEGLREHGCEEGRNLIVERRYAHGAAERFEDFAAEMVRLNVDVVVVVTTPAALAPCLALPCLARTVAGGGAAESAQPRNRCRLAADARYGGRAGNNASIPRGARTEGLSGYLCCDRRRAKAIGLAIPYPMLALADKVIE